MSARDPSASGRPADADATSSLDWARAQGLGDAVARAVAVRVARRRRRRWAAAGTLAVLVLVAGLWRAGSIGWPGRAETALVLRPAQRTLPDGTIVELRDGAEIAIAYDAAFRRVTLVRGEAHFAVTKNRMRPFVVTAGRVEVRAVGTAFSVQLAPAHVAVLVTEGRVAVERHAAAGGPDLALPPAALVDAGRQLVVSTKVESGPRAVDAPQVLAAPQLAERLAWRMPRLEFSGTSLAEVVALFNRHGHLRLVLADDSLAELKLSGVLRADNGDALLRVLATEFGIEAERRDDGEIRLHRGR